MIRQTTRLPEPLHTWLIDRAKANHRSLNAELISILSIEAAKSVGTGGGSAGAEILRAVQSDPISGTRGNER